MYKFIDVCFWLYFLYTISVVDQYCIIKPQGEVIGGAEAESRRVSVTSAPVIIYSLCVLSYSISFADDNILCFGIFPREAHLFQRINYVWFIVDIVATDIYIFVENFGFCFQFIIIVGALAERLHCCPLQTFLASWVLHKYSIFETNKYLLFILYMTIVTLRIY